MEEKKLNELKFHFCRAMAKHSNENRNIIVSTWDGIVETYKKRPYHNLSLIYNDLNTARKLSIGIPDEVIVASILQYYKFNPNLSNNLEGTINYISHFLKEPFGWTQLKIQEVVNLITASARIPIPLENNPYSEPYPIKLMFDMKMSRFAKPLEDFSIDRLNATKEFEAVLVKTFLNAERSILMGYNSAPELFTLAIFRKLTAQARENITYRLAFINKALSKLKGPF